MDIVDWSIYAFPEPLPYIESKIFLELSRTKKPLLIYCNVPLTWWCERKCYCASWLCFDEKCFLQRQKMIWTSWQMLHFSRCLNWLCCVRIDCDYFVVIIVGLRLFQHAQGQCLSCKFNSFVIEDIFKFYRTKIMCDEQIWIEIKIQTFSIEISFQVISKTWILNFTNRIKHLIWQWFSSYKKLSKHISTKNEK